MAKPAWLTLTPSSGNGNGVIVNTATAHTGRVARTGTVTVQGAGIAEASTYSVTQTPKAEFVSFDNGAEISATKVGGTLTIEGKTNATQLTLSLLEEGDLAIELPENYEANGVTTANAAVIEGDPGANAEFAFSLQIVVPANTTITEKTKTIKVDTTGGKTAQIRIVQAAGDPTLTISPKSITIPQDGSAVNVNVTANCAWTAS